MKVKEIKKWVKDHKKEIAIMSVSAAIGAICGVTLSTKSKLEDLKLDSLNGLREAMRGSTGYFSTINLQNQKALKDCPEIINELLETCSEPDLGITGMAVFIKRTK